MSPMLQAYLEFCWQIAKGVALFAAGIGTGMLIRRWWRP